MIRLFIILHRKFDRNLFAIPGLFLLTAIIFITGCPNSNGSKVSESNNSTNNPPIKEPFKITINSWIGFAPLYIAQEKGFFEQNGVMTELIRIEDTGARKSSMIAGKVDAYGASIDGVALDAAQGIPGRIIMAFDQSNGADGIIAKNQIKTVESLKGQTIAVQPGLTGHFLLLYLLEKNGLSPKDVKIVDMDSDKAGAAFAAGQLDVAVTWEPWLSLAQEKGGHKLVTSADLPGVIVDTLCVTDKAYFSKKDQIKGVVNAWFAALDFMKTNPNEAHKIMARAYGLTEEQVKEYLAGVKFIGKDDNRAYFGNANSPGRVFDIYNTATNIWKSSSIIESPTLPEDHIDTSFVQ